ncbi:MAG: cytochrome P450 [Myxococcota bacterium]
MVRSTTHHPVRRVQGPRGYPLVGSLPEFARDPLAFFERLRREYGELVPYFIGPWRLWLVTSPADVEQVLVSQASKLHKDRATRSLSRVLGDGLVTSENPLWKRQRKLAAPSFTPRHIASYGDIMVDAANNGVERALRDGAARARDVHHDMNEVTLEIVLRTLFGSFDDETERAGRAIGRFMHAFEDEMRSVYRLLPRWVPNRHRREMDQARTTLEAIVEGLIQQRRASGEEHGDLLGRLLAARDEDGLGMDDEQLRDEAITVFAAGHETTAVALTYALWLVARHPEIQDRLAQEAQEVLSGRRPKHDDVSRLPWHEAVVKETMRLYPPVWIVGRAALEPLTIGDVRIKAGDQLLMSSWIVHQDPSLWTGPEAFRPVRWLNGETDDHPRFAYFPYGGGPRVCIGSHFAHLEAVLVLATYLQRLEVRPDPTSRLELQPVVTLRPRAGTRLFFSPRA